MPIYNLNNQRYNIPDDVVNDFERDNPDATIAYMADGDIYDIPVRKRDKFLKKFPKAMLYDDKSQKPIAEQVREQETGEPYNHVYDGQGNLVGGAAYDAMNGKEDDTLGEPVKQVDIPDMFGGNKPTLLDKPLATKQEVPQFDVPTPMDNEFDRYYSVRKAYDDLNAAYKFSNEIGEKQNARIDIAKRNLQDVEYQKGRTEMDMRSLATEIDGLLEEEGRKERNIFVSSASMPAGARGRAYRQANEGRSENVSNLWAAKRLLEQSNYIVEAAKRGDTGILSDAWQGFKDSLEVEDFTFGLADAASSAAILDAIKKVEKGKQLTEAEDKLLRASAINMAVQYNFAKDLGRAYKAGQVTAESVPFMLEMAINPISSFGSASAKTLLNYGLKAFAKQVGKGLGRGVVAGAGMALTTGLGGVAAGTTDRLSGNYNYGVDSEGKLYAEKKADAMGVGEAALRSFATRAIENQSEMIFNAFKGVGGLMKGVEKYLPGGVNKFFNLLSNNRAADAYRAIKNSRVFRNYLIKDIRNATNIGGLGEEYLEEVYNNLANFAIGEMSWDNVVSLDQNIDTLLGLAPTQAMFALLGLGGAGAMRYQTRRVLEDLQATMNEQQRRELEGLMDMGLDATEVDVRRFIRGVMQNEGYTIDNKRDMIKAAFYVAKQKGIDQLTEADVVDKVNAENAIIDSVTDPSNGMYTELVATLPDGIGGRTEVHGHVVGWFGNGEKAQPVFVADGLENTYENRRVLLPNEWNPEDVQRMPAEQVKAVNEEMTREEAARQAERESKYAPDIINHVPLNEEQTIDDKGNIVTVTGVNADGVQFIYEDGNTNQVPLDTWRSWMQAQLEANEAAQAESERVAANTQAIVDSMKPKAMNDGTGRVLVATNVQGDEVAYDIMDANGNKIGEDVMKTDKFNEMLDHVAPEGEQLNDDGTSGENVGEGVNGGVNAEVDNTETPDGSDVKEDLTTGADTVSGVETKHEPTLEEVVASLPKKKDGKIDYDAMTPEQQFQYTSLSESPEVALEDLQSDIAANEEEIRKTQEQLAKAKGGKRAELRDKVNELTSANENLKSFYQSVAPKQEAQPETEQAIEPAKPKADKQEPVTPEGNAEQPKGETKPKKKKKPRLTGNKKKKKSEEFTDEELRPSNGVELAAEQFAAGNIKITVNSYKQELGYGEAERKKMGLSPFRSADKGGMTIEQAGEKLVEQDNAEHNGHIFEGDTMAARDAIIELFGMSEKWGDVTNHIRNKRMAERKSREEAEYAEYESALMESLHVTPEEFELLNESIEQRIKDFDVDSSVIDAIFAEAEFERQNNNEYEQGRIIEGNQGKPELLPEARAGDLGGNQRNESQQAAEGTGGKSDDNSDASQEGASGSEVAPSIEATNVSRMADIEAEILDIEGKKLEIEDELNEVGDNDLLRKAALIDEMTNLEDRQLELEAEYTGLRSMNDESNAISEAEGSGTRFRDKGKRSNEDKQAFVDRAKEWEDKTGVRVRIASNIAEVRNRAAIARILRGKAIAGWFEQSTGEVVLYMPNISSLDEVDATYIHEVVAHKGMAGLLGEKFDEFLDEVWNMMSAADQRKYWDYPGVESEKTDENRRRAAADEYIANTFESIDVTESVWSKLTELIKKFLKAIGIEPKMTNADIANTIKKSYQRLLSGVGTESNAGREGIRFRFSKTPQEFDAVQKEAVEKKGIVMPGLNEAVVDVIKTPIHDFSGKNPIDEARLWAEKNLVTSEQDKKENKYPKLIDGTPYEISKKKIGKFLSESATKKSEDIASHLSVLKKIKEIIASSIETEIHPDYIKKDEGRTGVEYNKNTLIHRLYGAANIEGKIYRVKTTIQEYRGSETNKPHSYEVIKIKLMDAPMTAKKESSVNDKERLSINSITGAKLLNGVEKSYDKGKKLLDESEKTRFRITKEERGIIDKAKADGTYMKAPNGEPTNLNEKQWAQVRTDAFKKWFGDWENEPEKASKIVDENGEPLVVYHGSDADFNVFDKNKGRANMDIQGMFFSPWDDDARGYGSNVRAFYLNIKNPANENTGYKALKKFQGQNGAGIKAREYLASQGYDGVNNEDQELIAFEPNQIKSATDNVGTFDGESNDIRFRVSNRNQEIFVSNAERAVEGIKQEKGTPQQWLAMIEKNGGLKAAEDKWLGLSDWLKGSDKKSITKAEILDFIGENKIRIEEVNYSENATDIDELFDEYEELYENEGAETAHNEMISRYGEEFDSAFKDIGGELRIKNQKAVDKLLGKFINSTRLNYTTKGLDNKQEIALTVPTIEPWNEGDEIHFGDAGKGRAVAWVRFGETKDSEGNKTLVIDEIQSKRHQEGREKGYKSQEVAALRKELEGLHEKLYTDGLTEEEYQRNREIQQRLSEIGNNGTIPEAPFEKNWHELAMKRMLRYAAENGYDKVAWTKGEQQADRYNISKVVDKIHISRFVDPLTGEVMPDEYQLFTYGTDRTTITQASGVMSAERVVEVFGKDLGSRLIDAAEAEKGNGEAVVDGEDLRVGGEGMKGFYDRMLPSFVNKYVKKWGTKVQDIELPDVEEAGRIMHSVDVTDAMKESVMEGQTMFRISRQKMEAINKELEDYEREFHGKQVNVVESSMSEEELEAVFEGKWKADEIRDYMAKEKAMGGYIPIIDKIVIFADRMKPHRMKESLHHENIHGLLAGGKNTRLFVDFYEYGAWEAKAFEEWAKFVEQNYKPHKRAEEFFAYVVSNAMLKDDLEDVFSYLSTPHQTELKELLKQIGYDYDVRRRSIEGEPNDGRREEGVLGASVDKGNNGQVSGVSGETGRGNSEGEKRSPREKAEKLRELFGQVADMGLDGVLGNGHYDKAMMDIYRELPEDARKIVADDALARPKVDFIGAMNDYLNNAEISIWDKVAGIVRSALRKVGFDLDLTENDVKYLLWRSRKPLDKGDLLDVAEDIDKKYRLKVGEYSGSPARFRAKKSNGVKVDADEYAKISRQIATYPGKTDRGHVFTDNNYYLCTDIDEEGNFKVVAQLKIEGNEELINSLRGENGRSNFKAIEGTEDIASTVEEVRSRGGRTDRDIPASKRQSKTGGRNDSVHLGQQANSGTDKQSSDSNDGKGTRFRVKDKGEPMFVDSSDFDRLKNEIQNQKQEIGRLRKVISEYENEDQVKDEIVKFIRRQVGAKLSGGVSKTELNLLLAQVREAKSKKTIERVLNNVNTAIQSAQRRELQRVIDNLLSLKVQDVNGKNMSIAKNVDDSTRKVFDFIRGHASDLKVSAYDDSILQLKRDNRDLQLQKQAYNRELSSSGTGKERKEELEGLIADADRAIADNVDRIKELRELKNDILKHKADYADMNIDKEMEKLEEKIAKAAEGKAVWTQGDTERLAAMNIIQAIITNRKHDFEVENIEEQIKDLQMANSELNKVRIKVENKDKRNEISEQMAENRRQIASLQRLINDARATQISQMRETIEQLNDLISNGKNSLMRKVEEEVRRKGKIIGNGLRAVEGKPIDIFDDKAKSETWYKKFFSAPLGSFEYMCKRINVKTLGKDGFFYKYFIQGENGVLEAYNSYINGLKEVQDRMKAKSLEIFGKSYDKIASESDKVVKESGVHIYDIKPGTGYGERYEKPMSKAQAMYIYMVWKMDDGRTKLELQGFDEESIAEIVEFIGDDYVKYADWIQEELLPDTRLKYNEKYLELFNTSMADIPNYVPLRIRKESVYQESDLSADKQRKKTLEERAGSLINRVVNTNPVDITMSAFDVVNQHVNQMEEWNAYARVRRDLDALLSNTTFRNQLNANVRGSFENFYDAAAVATKAYHPERAKHMDEVLGKLSKGIVGGNIAFRWSTALKQILSAPAFFGYSQHPLFAWKFAKSAARVDVSYKWAMENLPSFHERIESGTAGNEKLDEKAFNKWMDKYFGVGMWLNKGVDTITCSIGARSIYEFKMEQLAKQGLDEEEARRQALMDADIYYNATQQSSHPAFMSPMQMSRTLADRMLTTYQNSNIGYVRKVLAAYYDLTRSRKWKELMANYTEMYMREENLNEEDAKVKARARLLNENRKAVVEIALFGWGLNILWNIGSEGLLGFFTGGDDDDDKDKWTKDIGLILTSPVKGMPGGNLLESISQGYGMNPFLVYEELEGFIRSCKYAVDEYGLVSPEVAYKVLETASRYSGVDLQVWGNMYMGVEGAIRDGAVDGDGWIDFMYFLSSPKSAREEVAKTLYKGEPLLEFAEKLNRARKYVPRDNPWESWVPGNKPTTKRQENEAKRIHERLNMTESERKEADEKKIADKFKRKLKEYGEDKRGKQDYIDRHKDDYQIYLKYYKK